MKAAISRKTVKNWANFPQIEAEIAHPESPEQLSELCRQWPQFIARGNGKCYGDAALSPRICSTLAFKKILNFDAQNGIIECEAGVLLSGLLPTIVAAGWFFHVTPGIKAITVGGAIASDVHGKNHPEKVCFSQWLLSFELMQSDGSVLRCSRAENAELFYDTCGGMGWTGVILSARFQLMPLKSVRMQQKTRRFNNFEDLFAAMEAPQIWPYAAAWIDMASGGSRYGRGAVFFAKHIESADAKLEYPKSNTISVPFLAPSWLLNRFSMQLYNTRYFAKNADRDFETDIDSYFYPLDRLLHWNRLYGKKGFVQYQFCVPQAHAFQGLKAVLNYLKNAPDTPFLTVLKKHGPRPAEFRNSFPVEGYSLAMDFPKTRHIFQTVRALDEILAPLGAKIYLTKDACSAPEMAHIDPRRFGADKFFSLLKGRLLAP